MSRISKVEFKMGRELPESVRVANNFSDSDFVEIRIENSEPTLFMEKVLSPAKKVNEILKREGVTIVL